MKNFFFNNPLFRILWPPIYGTIVYLLILLLNNNLDQLNDSFFGQELYFCIILSYLVFESMRVAINISFKKHDLEPGLLATINLVLVNLAIAALVVFIGVNIYFRFVLGFSSGSIFSNELIIFLVVFLFSSLFYTSIAISTSYLFRENRNQLQHEQILKENLELELIKFKNEINPDLLYDSLESLISLIHKNAEEAEDYIDRMAMVYRYILSSRNSELVKIDQEIKALTNIIFLLNYKHHNNIKLSYNVDPAFENRLIIPGSISSVVEIMVRNTIISDFQPLTINFETGTDEYIVISHALNEKLRLDAENNFIQLQRAYSIYTEKPVVSVKAYGENFVKIPLLQLEQETV